MTTLTARLHPKWVGGRDGYRYSVICRGELIVDRSRDPECDAARALLARGITGKLTMLDGKTGIPRIIIDPSRLTRSQAPRATVRCPPEWWSPSYRWTFRSSSTLARRTCLDPLSRIGRHLG
jgi:hypothetical protein